MTLALEPVLAYQQVVRAATETYLNSLTAGDLDRVVKTARGDRNLATIFTIVVNHALIHSGEIGALKGVQAGKV